MAFAGKMLEDPTVVLCDFFPLIFGHPHLVHMHNCTSEAQQLTLMHGWWPIGVFVCHILV